MENYTKKKINLFKDKRAIEDGFKHLIFAFVLVSLFAMILFTIIISQGGEYSKDPEEVLQGMDVQGINDTVNSFDDNAQVWNSALNTNSTGLSLGFGVVGAGLESIFFIGTSMFTMIMIPFDYISSIMVNVLKVPSWIASVILSLVIMAGIFGIYRLIKWGS